MTVHLDRPKCTPLYRRHLAACARMTTFAGYQMPLQYPSGILHEHLQTRTAAGLFDVSHMGQATLRGPSFASVARALEAIVPADILNIKPGQQRYTQLLNDAGGIFDDLMVSRPEDDEHSIDIVVNAACKVQDYEHIQRHLPPDVALVRKDALALVALQGPQAEAVLRELVPSCDKLKFMQVAKMLVAGIECNVARCGYTGEDGFEISIPADRAEYAWDALVRDPRVVGAGLAARDTLRLEAGFCLYGADLDQTISPVEADLAWSIQKRRREEGGFLGASRIQRELIVGVQRIRVGLSVSGRVPVRGGSPLFAKESPQKPIGVVTSGSFGPSVGASIAMGYVPTSLTRVGQPLLTNVRGQQIELTVQALPFIPNRFKR